MSKTYTYYTGSGKISCNRLLLSDDEANLNLSDGESWILGSYDPEMFWVVDGVPKEIPSRTDEFSTFNPDLWVWEVDLDYYWANLKNDRNRLLAASDWTQVPDAPVDQAAWATYRQQLRDLPANTEDPANPVWPIQPS
jgi:hypothetical protein